MEKATMEKLFPKIATMVSLLNGIKFTIFQITFSSVTSST